MQMFHPSPYCRRLVNNNGLEGTMTESFNRVSIYVPKSNQPEKPIKRLYELGLKRDRSLNYMIVTAILDYVNRQEKKKKK
jgi:hypothetical protein